MRDATKDLSQSCLSPTARPLAPSPAPARPIDTTPRPPVETDMSSNKTEVVFPSADPECQLRGDLTLPSPAPVDGDGREADAALVPAIVIVGGSGVSDARPL